jgi:FlaA1/EpsC-like NDP-sugar epimerase
MSVSPPMMRLLRRVTDRGPIRRFGVQIALDAFAWVVAVFTAGILRFELDLTKVVWSSFALVALFLIVVQITLGLLLFLYRGRHPYGSFAEVLTLGLVVASAAVLVGVPVLIFGNQIGIPRSTVILAAPIAIFIMAAMRYLKRLIVERSRRPGEHAAATLIYGAGYMGSLLVRRMLTDAASPYLPVGLIDDDPQRTKTWHSGVRVLGTGEDLVEIAKSTDAKVLVVAITRADSELLRRISDLARPAGLRVRVLPPFQATLDGLSRLGDLRDISIDDLIGRTAIDTQVEAIASYLTGKRVLVTGAGGSIGGELARQVAKYGPDRIILLDRDETSLQATQVSMIGRGLFEGDDFVLVDVRDRETLFRIFADLRPEVVFHAAALKHLAALERYPAEAWKTNVLGTLNVVEAALAADVVTFVNISTDKAANPTSVLGKSKQLGERLVAWAARKSGRSYLSVRFGNVLGSRGSMVPLFTHMINAGGPLTITDRNATRYFMSMSEACQLVVQAGAIGDVGEVLILDMGEPVRILDVAERMIEMSGRDIGIVFTGLREGEKLHEDLLGPGERDHRPVHPRISHTPVEPLDPAALTAIGPDADGRVTW